ncbi:hypothetical protein [Tropicimonas sp. IMCC34043]|uniref:hypothetical protein n=1 Tax=Tropicimonas sp. IMCC34043 TaxID=2248760 RepID=UPI000E27031B|nr:hypothetical protein [Tropicimonas sp. IMCC34043]
MTEWKQVDAVFPASGKGFGPYGGVATLQVDPGSGTVEIQLQDAASTWVTGSDLTFSEAGVYKIDVENTPPLRVHVTGDAKYRFTWRRP